MFFRTKKSGSRSYLQIAENRWENGRSRQRVITTLGRLDQLQESGQLDALLAWIPIEGKPANISTCSGSGLSENFSSCAIDLVILRQE
jgi:hypothetical protein